MAVSTDRLKGAIIVAPRLEVLFKEMGKLVAACPYDFFEAKKYGQNIFPPDYLGLFLVSNYPYKTNPLLPAKLPQMMIVVFINKIAQLFFGHFSKKGMHKNRGGETGVFLYHDYPFAFLGGYVAGSFMHN
jgi:hypothetical protein